MKTTIKRPRQRKKQKMTENNSKLCYLENLTLNLKKFEINRFYFTQKKQFKKKYLIQYLKEYQTKAIFITLNIARERTDLE